MCREEIKGIVRKLFDAENNADRVAAEPFIAADFIPIVRASGRPDASREETLDKTSKQKKTFMRDVVAIDVALFMDNQLAIATTLLKTTDTSDEAKPIFASYRNMHVFLRRDDQWQCVAWQVTQVH